ncbi:MAG: 4'-phosphopantetheinyl transferase superfamily protein [Gammaproteobacteria bacterium]|nr:4'-phosphopantetheinyl transferase superfamily protein [Gammaproteobacteria bacterium]HRX71472.1 4'-phosphopantetheinyl transferase superfamily protein [Candidatus Competibacteraceae bacterium]
MIDPLQSMRGAAPALAAEEAHLWLANLRLPAERLAVLTATLTVDERERAGRFRFPEHQDRFIAGRGLLRELLGIYLDQPAALIRFNQGPRGKPVLVGQPAETCLHFNLSHSSDQVLYAIARCEVGVDLEDMNRRLDYAAVAERICTSREWAVFQELPPACAREEFFACWTRKEAVVKALGEGLAHGLGKLEVCLQGDDWVNQRVGLRDAADREWSVLNVPIEPGWVAALAAPGADWRWRGWRWNAG